jgi:hypothetical protein
MCIQANNFNEANQLKGRTIDDCRKEFGDDDDNKKLSITESMSLANPGTCTPPRKADPESYFRFVVPRYDGLNPKDVLVVGDTAAYSVRQEYWGIGLLGEIWLWQQGIV